MGGAVRDQLLGLQVRERDWVVVGGTPETLIQQGYHQVGRDFPVFLHPLTHEEYALARTECKITPGYHGFICDFNPKVSLVDDLFRRDLTINAMAMDSNGRLIDPYHGQDDLRAKVLRHVSPAFIEDPVRVLRVARFAARFHHLGFQLADETRSLMGQMVKRGELVHLVAERVWQEWQRSLGEQNPDLFIITLRQCGALKVVLPEIDALFGIPNKPQEIPDIDTGVHALTVLRAATVLTEDHTVRFAAFTHEVGKACTPMGLWPMHPNHDIAGMKVIEQLCQRLRIPTVYRMIAQLMLRFHARVQGLYELSPEAVVECLEQSDAFRRRGLFEKLLIATEAKARAMGYSMPYQLARDWNDVLDECCECSAQPLIEQGYQGEAIQLALRQQRALRVKTLLGSWNRHEK